MLVPDGPQVGSTVWIVGSHHTWDAHLNNTYFPVQRKVTGVEGGFVHLKNDLDKHIVDCYASEEQCAAACPEPHADE